MLNYKKYFFSIFMSTYLMGNNIKIDLQYNFRLWLNIGLVIFIITTITTLITLKFTVFKKSKEYKKYFNNVYYDLVKYLLIEFFLISIEAINTGNVVVTDSLGRIAAVHCALLVFSAIKGPLGIN